MVKKKREWVAKTVVKAERKRNVETDIKKGKVGRPKKALSPEKMLKDVLPMESIFDEKELEWYRELVKVYMADFDAEDLTSSDMDDILDLSKNRVLEIRLLVEAKGNPEKLLDIAATTEKLSKKNEKIKESLSFRRKDRINPNEFKGFSIVDLAVAFDMEKRAKLQNKISKLKDEEKDALERRSDYTGNKYDIVSEESDITDG